jgi:hypothetical protein
MDVRSGRWAWFLRALGRVCGRLLAWLAPHRSAPRRVAEPVARLERVGASGSPRLAREIPSREPLPPGDGALAHGDFLSAEEAQRFAALPPIAPGAAEGVDWDALARDFDARA